MPMELTDSLKTLLIETAQSLKGSARRLFMARTVKELGRGGQQRAARELRWGRMTIRKGMHELDSGVMCVELHNGAFTTPICRSPFSERLFSPTYQSQKTPHK
jgi:hypothetical protein